MPSSPGGSSLLLVDFVFVLVSKIVPPPTAAPCLAAVVTHIAVIAPRFAVAPMTSIGTIRVFLEHAMG